MIAIGKRGIEQRQRRDTERAGADRGNCWQNTETASVVTVRDIVCFGSIAISRLPANAKTVCLMPDDSWRWHPGTTQLTVGLIAHADIFS